MPGPDRRSRRAAALAVVLALVGTLGAVSVQGVGIEGTGLLSSRDASSGRQVAASRREMPGLETSTSSPAPTTTSPSLRLAAYQVRNHAWSRALRIDDPVYWFPCSRSRPPGNVVYRWGCAGRNNVYLFGHAANVFSGLNRAYYERRLRVGLRVQYTDSAGRLRTYAVRWWKVVYPTTAASWAWASLSRPSMTLQTCVGGRSEKRLIVRLVQVF